jgi:uncharacterized membrane protein (UPF0127 family)
MSRHRFVLIATLAAAMLPSIPGCRRRNPEPKLIVNGHSFAVEIADTPDMQRLGLSGRPSLPADRAMLFVFPAEANRSFYMKDCYFPIDIAFLDADRRIINLTTMAVEAVPTNPVGTYRSDAPAMFVVEAVGGTWQRTGAAAGMQVEFVDVPIRR